MQQNESLIKIFQLALNQEKTGMNFFSNALSMMGVGEAISAFKMLVSEEKKHIIFIERILRDLTVKGEVDIATVQEGVSDSSDFFAKHAQGNLFEESIQNSMVPDITVFNTAWLIEKDISEFYGRMAEKTVGKPREALQMLAEWEKGHEKFFREYRDQLSRLYSDMAWGG